MTLDKRLVQSYGISGTVDIGEITEADDSVRMAEIEDRMEAAARDFSVQMITGNGTSPNMQGLDNSNVIGDGTGGTPDQVLGDTETNGTGFSLGLLDDLMTKCQYGVDALVVHPLMISVFRAALRKESQGGLISETMNLPHPFADEEQEISYTSYSGLPILFNKNIPVTAQGSESRTASIYAIKWDRGGVTPSRGKGLSAITIRNRGIYVKAGGMSYGNHSDFYRVYLIGNLVNYDPLSCAKYAYVHFKLLP